MEKLDVTKVYKSYFTAQSEPELEDLWWYDEEPYTGKKIATAIAVPRNAWEYPLLIRMPEFVQPQDVASTVATVIRKKKTALASSVEYKLKTILREPVL